MPTLKKIDQTSSLIILLIATLYLYENTKLLLWEGTTPGSGFFPMLLGIVLIVLTILLFVKVTIAAKDDSLSRSEGLFPSKSGFLRLLYLIGVLIVYVLTLQLLGYVLSTLLFLCALFLAWDPKRPWSVVALTVVIVLCTYVLFVLLLEVRLPKGLLD